MHSIRLTMLRTYGNSLEWSSTTETCGRSVVKCWPLSQTLWESVGRQRQPKKNKTKNLPWKWDSIHQQAFDDVKATIARDVVLAYPDFTKPFEIYSDLTRDELGLTSNRVYQWRLLLEEFSPEIVCIKEIHNTVADAISWLEYNPEVNLTNEQSFANIAESTPMDVQRWKGFSALLHYYNENNPGCISTHAT